MLDISPSFQWRPSCKKKKKKMKIQCDVCEKAPATVICCADEAALCAKCDVEVHAANKLASKHQRLHLQCLSNKLPRCDICQVQISIAFSFPSLFNLFLSMNLLVLFYYYNSCFFWMDGLIVPKENTIALNSSDLI